MSLFFESDTQLNQSLDQLPPNFSNAEIEDMVKKLQNDIRENSNRYFSSLSDKIMYYSETNRQFCLSYPMLFRGIVKGSFTRSMLTTFLATREKLRKGELDKEEAQNNLVDEGVKHIQDKQRL